MGLDMDRDGAEISQVRRRILLICLAGLAISGFAVVRYATNWGPWAFSDGVGYLATARNLAEGRGLGLYRPSGSFVPTVTHPPLLPFLLALVTKATGDVLQAARWLNSLLIAVMLIAVPILLRRLLVFGSLAAILGLLLLTHPAIILMFISAMSEPLFVVVGTLSLLMICLYLVNPIQRYLAIACALAAAALLTRYVGLAYVLSSALALIAFDRRGSVRKRALRATAFSVVAILPTLAFITYWTQSPYARTVRRFSLPPSFGESVTLFISRVGESIWSWKPAPTQAVLGEISRLPAELTILIVALAGLLIALPGIVRWILAESPSPAANQDRHVPLDPWLPPKLLGLFAVIFLGMMFLAFAFGVPTPDIDSRTLFPILPSMMVVGICAVGALLSKRRSRTVRWLAAASLLVLIAGSLPAWIDIVAGVHRTGLGFTARAWQESETMKFVTGLDPGRALVSNSPEAIMLHAGRSAYPIPASQGSGSSALDAAEETGDSRIDSLICQEDGYLALFDPSLDGVNQEVDPALVPVSLSCQPELIFQGPDGAVYSHQLAPD